MVQSLEFEYTFHGVGQGLFASGCLRNRVVPFRWVYDCGTHSGRTILNAALKRLLQPDVTSIGLAALSHFDKDHINGITELIGRCRVDTLLLPYIPLWQRLLLAFIEGVAPTDRLMRFYLNPVTYLTEGGDGPRVGRVLLVPSGGGPAPEPPAEPQDLKDTSEPLEFDPHEESSDLTPELTFLRNGAPGVSVELLKPGGTICVRRCWEFVPYNDAEYAHLADAKFCVRAQRLARDLLGSKSIAAGNEDLKKLKDLYDARFGKRRRNEISLFLYSGPLRFHDGRSAIYTFASNQTVLRSNQRLLRYRNANIDHRSGVLYTGDGTLHNPKRLNALLTYLTQHRVLRIGPVQVMHHGSRYNWHRGVAVALSPIASVFCSDPQHRTFKHPHVEVLHDFLNYGPMQADRKTTCVFHGVIYH